MAVLKNGLSGHIQGPIGDLTYYFSNGQWIIRSKRSKTTIPPTEKQLASRQKFKVVNDLLKKITEFVKAGFANVTMEPGILPYNVATSQLLYNAVKGNYPNYELDYPRVLLSSGPLSPAIEPVIECNEDKLIFQWKTVQEWPDRNDSVMLLAYCPELNMAIYELNGAKRVAGTDSLVIPTGWLGKTVETYISFRSEDRKRIANSVHTGTLLYI